MIIKYDITVTILNIINNSTSTFAKTFEKEINMVDALLYNNYHILSKDIYILDMFRDEIDAYCSALNIEVSSIEVDEFEIVSLTDKVDVFFESEDPSDNTLSLKPIIKCYVHPKNDALKVPKLEGSAYDSTTIIWSWPEDEQYAHYLVEEAVDITAEENKPKIIAQLPIGATSYTETGLEPNTPYTRRLINYTDEQTSAPSPSVTVMTETVEVSESLEQYVIPKNYDFTTDDSEREIIEERLEAFHSGIGDDKDLKVYKQMDANFYQKFKAYFEITGRRIQREKRYEQVGFNYKICLEAKETINEQEGEVTFDIDVYPREEISIRDYMWVTDPVTVKARMSATVFLSKNGESEETEEIKLYKPKTGSEIIVHPKKVTFIGDPLGVVFVIDKTNSLKGETITKLCHKEGHKAVISAVKTCINKIEDKAEKLKNKYNKNIKVKYAIISFGKGAKLLTNGFVKAEKAKEKVSTIIPEDSLTSWGAGIKEANKLRSNSEYSLGDDAKYIAYFFSDGFPNANSKNVVLYDKGGKGKVIGDLNGVNYCQSFTTGTNNYDGNISIKEDLQSLTNTMHHKYDRVGAFICNFGKGNDYADIVDTSSIGNTLYTEDYIRIMHKMVASKPKYAKFWNNSQQMEKVFTDFIKEFTEVKPSTTEEKEKFDGWEELPDDTTNVYKYSIDDTKAVKIISDTFEFTFDNSITPVIYDDSEKRAIISPGSFIKDIKLSNKSVYDIILDAVKNSEEWNMGYNQPVKTENGDFLIKGLHIQDTYDYHDGTYIDDYNWNETWEDGMEGSVNTYTDIDKAGTTSFGDDCYVVSKNNYLMIQGYTDAIIYDGLRYATYELNAYNQKEVEIVGPGQSYNSYLYNRKDKSHTYQGSSDVNHMIKILEKGKDIYLPGSSYLQEAGDEEIFEPLYDSLWAKINVMYSSPVLNYRFNLEDPDARTPLYEILPDCDRKSEYLNVVIIHVYYAKNVYISSEKDSYYISQYRDDPLATSASPYYPLIEDMTKFTLMEWKDGIDNGKYIDEYIWFMARPMKKTQDYYDELPGPGIDTFYGLVNGRYREDNQNGKKDLVVDTPQFNIPTTVHKDTVKIYIMITEFYPESALVSYKWAHPYNQKNAITQVNGDYVTFSSDSLTYKDVEYYDIISTENMESQEVFDNKTNEKIFELSKPETIYEYNNYYLKVSTDNSDVIALRYPTEITFDNNNKSEIGVAFKGVVNATSKWSPIIHNGYYYLNQHEYFAYCEFNVEANFDKIEEINFKRKIGYISFDVQLRHKAGPKESYSIIKDTRSELLQDEESFVWIDNKGLTVKPFIDGVFYKKYLVHTYISPVILFPNVLTKANVLSVNYVCDNGAQSVSMKVRSYIVDEGKWSDWTSFTNNTVPNVPLSCGYQVMFDMEATTWENDMTIEDYMCCYLDWKDDMDANNTTNIVTITDHMTTGPDKAKGIFISKIIDFGCETEINLDIFESYYKQGCLLYAAVENTNPHLLLIENIEWENITNNGYPVTLRGRYLRYKIEIPAGEKVYWLHKKFITKQTHVVLPYLTGISMSGEYKPTDVVTNFINTEAFNIPADDNFHIIFDRVIDVIGADVLEKGFKHGEIEYVKIQCTSPSIDLSYSSSIESHYPGSALENEISARAKLDTDIVIKNTPYIFSETEDGMIVIKITKGTPQQYCPITIEDESGNTYTQIYDNKECILNEQFDLTEETKYIELYRNDYDKDTLEIYLNNVKLNDDKYDIVNHLVIFKDFLNGENKIVISYKILNSFYAEVDRVEDTTTIYLYTNHKDMLTLDNDKPRKFKVYFETSTRNNKFIAKELSLNPIYRTDYKGFIYLTDEHNEPYSMNIYCNPCRLKAGGYDKVDVSIEVLDILNNPVISKDIGIECNYGIINCDSYTTDMNGVVHIVYCSSYKKSIDTLTAKVLTDDNNVIQKSINIINE